MTHYNIYNEDSLLFISELDIKSYDMIFADPPYFLSNNGVTNISGKRTSVNKAEWDKEVSFEEMHLFNRKWISKCKKVLKDEGTIFITGTFHNIYSIGVALNQEGFRILNNITWEKNNPPPNLGCRCFTHSTETIIWAKKDLSNNKHYFNYKLMKELNDNKQMKDVWRIKPAPQREKKCGRHPTQKPEELLERIIMCSTREDDIILDPFLGSGTTMVVAKKLNRRCDGIELNKDYIKIVKKRLKLMGASDVK